MDKNTVLYVIIALLTGFIGGFVLANSLNRNELMGKTSTISTNANGANQNVTSDSPELSDAEIKAKIDEADRNPENFDFQKQLGTGLYRYAATKSSVPLLMESQRILQRANGLNGNDIDILIALGNAEFDIGFFEKDAKRFATARELYTKALAINPNDADVQTDLSISYMLQSEPDLDKAIAGLEKAQSTDSRHPRSLQFLVEALIRKGDTKAATASLAKLKEIDPRNRMIPELETKLVSPQPTPAK